jgi:hypothetical protein
MNVGSHVGILERFEGHLVRFGAIPARSTAQGGGGLV